MPKFDPLAAANSFLEKAGESGLTHMQLQKLVYLAHEEWLKTHAEPFLDENPQVWQYGPVFSNMYHWLKEHGKSRIVGQVDQGPYNTPTITDNEVAQTIDSVWNKYGTKSGVWLSELTHKTGTAWRNLAEKHKFSVPFGTEITPKDIKEAVQ